MRRATDSPHRCPHCYKRMFLSVHVLETNRRIDQVLHECWHCDYRFVETSVSAEER